jgi:sulfotransferase family protein
MKVIGAGFARTGTASLMQALETLGFGPCYHMFAIIQRPDRVRQWLAIADGGADARPDWDEIFEGFQSAVDWPVAAYWRELAAYYPDAKIILTVRDPRRWYDSAAATIFRFRLRADRYPIKAISTMLTLANPEFAKFTRMTDTIVWRGVLDGRFADRAHAIDVFDRHVDEVRKRLPADRLLVYNVAEGWEPLCSFLDVPVPDEPFPNVNDTDEFQRFWRRQMASLLTRPALAAVGGAAGLTFLIRRWRRRR